jgi:diadenosine tetraphosphate (Ap4A) HIT family hydrolase/5-methylcytosine-specific restriction endonuclease McrA
VRTPVNYSKLKNYIEREMVMQHIYQPVMLKTLLRSKEYKASIEDIAREFLINDEPQLQYYKYITKVMPSRVLRSHGIVIAEDDKFALNIGGKLTREQVRNLTHLCDLRIERYEQRYGRKSIWHSRFAGAQDISGPLQYEVLRRAKGRCELCGISRTLKALQVDHITPRSKGGLTVLENLQALCYTCNAQKQNKDDTDFRDWEKMYDIRAKDCVFCHLAGERIEIRNSLAMAFDDRHPVTDGHMLVSPLRHIGSFFNLGSSEQKACLFLLEQAKKKITGKDPKVTGFNVGVNDGRDAGQTVMHCHIHLIPRRKGDVADPRGGIRHVMPGRGRY